MRCAWAYVWWCTGGGAASHGRAAVGGGMRSARLMAPSARRLAPQPFSVLQTLGHTPLGSETSSALSPPWPYRLWAAHPFRVFGLLPFVPLGHTVSCRWASARATCSAQMPLRRSVKASHLADRATPTGPGVQTSPDASWRLQQCGQQGTGSPPASSGTAGMGPAPSRDPPDGRRRRIGLARSSSALAAPFLLTLGAGTAL